MSINSEDFSIQKEDKKNFKHSVIERGNLTSVFTVGELEDDMLKLDRQERELEGQVKVSKAAVDNIERNHAFVKKLTDEQLRTAAYVFETKSVLEKAEQGLKAVKKAKKQYKEVLATVYAKFGFSNETTK